MSEIQFSARSYQLALQQAVYMDDEDEVMYLYLYSDGNSEFRPMIEESAGDVSWQCPVSILRNQSEQWLIRKFNEVIPEPGFRLCP